MDFSNIHLLSVIVAGIASWILGALWYSPLLFSKKWQTESGLSDEDIQGANMALIFGGSLVLMMVMSLGLASLVQNGEPDLMRGLKTGFLVGLFFAATSIGINYLYQRKSMALYAIDAIYQVLLLSIAGTIVGTWQ